MFCLSAGRVWESVFLTLRRFIIPVWYHALKKRLRRSITDLRLAIPDSDSFHPLRIACRRIFWKFQRATPSIGREVSWNVTGKLHFRQTYTVSWRKRFCLIKMLSRRLEPAYYPRLRAPMMRSQYSLCCIDVKLNFYPPKKVDTASE